MKRFALIFAAILAVCSCGKTPSAVISGKADDIKDTTILLQKMRSGALTTVDTLKVDSEGAFKCKVDLKKGCPAFYYFSDGTNTLANIVALPGDKIKLSLLEDGEFKVEGSRESVLLQEVNREFNLARYQLSVYLDALDVAADAKTAQALRQDIGKAYVDYKRFALAHAMNNPTSITSAAIFFQKFSDELPVFGELTDVLVFRQVYDSISTVYPESEYVIALYDEIKVRENMLDLNNKLSQMEAVGHPEISLPDVDGVQRPLSELDGKVIMLIFWSAGMEEMKMFNHTLADVYAKYNSRGFEIYQVSLDLDKASWASTIKSQGLGWINVNDGLGSASKAAALYNIRQVPTMFLINRGGDIVAKDIFEASALDAAVKKLL